MKVKIKVTLHSKSKNKQANENNECRKPIKVREGKKLIKFMRK